jgi:capsular polysaccharide biosynthesis protein
MKDSGNRPAKNPQIKSQVPGLDVLDIQTDTPLKGTIAAVSSAALFSFIAAGVFSIGLVFAADRFDPSFRTAEEVIQSLGAPVLASLPARVERPHQRGDS